MRTIAIDVFKFDELDVQAKERAREWYRLGSDGDNYFAESVIDDAVEVAKCLGIVFENRCCRTLGGTTVGKPKLWWSGFSSQGDGASFEGHYSAPKGKAADLIKDYAPQDVELLAIATRLDALQEKYEDSLSAKVSQSGRYCHAYTMRLDYAEVLDAEGERVDLPADDEEEVLDCLRDFANWIYSRLEKEYDYQNSDEVVDETIRINEYEFDADGRRSRYA
jgi:hypothetical protein